MSQAQLLQCPDCGHRHDLAVLGDVHTFRCNECGRALKVPVQFRNGAESTQLPSDVPPPPALSFDQTIRQPTVAPAPVPEPVPQPAPDNRRARAAAAAAVPPSRRDREHPRVPLYWRLLIWIAAIPIGLVIVFQLIARKLGWLTQNELIDAFTAGGWDRFRPIAQLLPLAAFVIAAIVQGSVFGLERWYRRRARLRAEAATPHGAGTGFTATGS